MVALLRVLLRAVGEHHAVPGGEQILTHQQDVGPGGDFTSCHLLALPHKRQAVEECNKLLCRNTQTGLFSRSSRGDRGNLIPRV